MCFIFTILEQVNLIGIYLLDLHFPSLSFSLIYENRIGVKILPNWKAGDDSIIR